VATSGGATVWQVGEDDDLWLLDRTGGGAQANFVQEAGVNELPGDPANPVVAREGDDDYYFAGVYSTVLDGGTYTPVGTVAQNEEGAERAYAGVDNSLRYHFNLDSLPDLFSVTFDALNLHGQGGTERYGVEVYFNGVLVGPEVEVNPGTLDFDFETPTFTPASVNAQAGAGFDNYVELRGINYNADGGGNWMGVDYVQLNAVPEPSPLGLALLAGAGALMMRRMRK
ncbi:MAG: hypothetical protein P8J87_18880, partial [Verrucomicrobiales bacterium]|nr:hypothetical protein [Verrucomicrobiales bacterium]